MVKAVVHLNAHCAAAKFLRSKNRDSAIAGTKIVDDILRGGFRQLEHLARHAQRRRIEFGESIERGQLRLPGSRRRFPAKRERPAHLNANLPWARLWTSPCKRIRAKFCLSGLPTLRSGLILLSLQFNLLIGHLVLGLNFLPFHSRLMLGRLVHHLVFGRSALGPMLFPFEKALPLGRFGFRRPLLLPQFECVLLQLDARLIPCGLLRV